MQSRVSSRDKRPSDHFFPRFVHAICQTCRSFCELGPPEIFHTLVRRHRSGLSYRCQALRLSADKITSWAPTMFHLGRFGTIAHKTFPASSWGNSFKVSVFGRNQTIKHHSNVFVQDPLKRAILPTSAGKALVCHCPAHEECHADALVQAYESEVMVCSNIPTPVTPQQNDTSVVAAPHGFSRSADGVGVRSFGDWLAPRAGISDIFFDLRHAIIEIVSKRGLHHAATRAWGIQRYPGSAEILSASGRSPSRPVHSSRPTLSRWAHPPPVAAHARPRHWPHRHCRVRFPHGRLRTNTALWYLASTTI